MAKATRPPRRGVAAVGSTVIASQILVGVAGIVAARNLGPAGRGIVAGVLIWAQTLPYLALAGLNSSLTVRVASGASNGLGTVIGSALAYSTAAGVVVLIPALIVIPPTVGALGAHARSLAAVALLIIPFGILTELLCAVLLASHRLRRYNLARLMGPAIILAGTLALAATHRVTPTAIVGVTLGATGVTLVVLATGMPWREFKLAPGELARDIVFGVKTAVGGWAAIVNLRFDILVMSAVVSASQLGLYGTANNTMLPVATIASAAASLLTPSVARLGADMHRQVLLIRRQLVRYARLSLVGGIILAAAAPVVVPMLFGRGFTPAVVLVWILIPGYLARVCSTMVTAGAIGMRRPGVGNRIEGWSLLVTVALLPVLLPRYGAVGAAVTSTAAYLVAAAIAVLSLRRLSESHTPQSG